MWSFAYYNLWYDMNNETLDHTLNFGELQVRGRGALLVWLLNDADGDWLTDFVENYITGTNATDSDSDLDLADDYVEVSFLHSDPWNPDTDGGGTIDGIEYFEGLNASNPQDDMLSMPDWYVNHFTVRAAQLAANLLLKKALRPTSDQLTWPSLLSSVVNVSYNFDGAIPYALNETINWANESILSIDVGNLDADQEKRDCDRHLPHRLCNPLRL